MTDKKPTDNEIRMAFEYWKQFDNEIDILIKRYPEGKAELLEQKEISKITFGVFDLINRQKAEIERLEYTLLGVMHSVDKWLEGEELEQDEVNRAIAMREKTLQIVEEKQAEIERLRNESDELAEQLHNLLIEKDDLFDETERLIKATL